MLKKSERLDRKAFSDYFSKGKRKHGLYTTIITSPTQGFFGAVVVGKKVSKQAVVRNSVRRRLYSILDKARIDNSLQGVFIIITKPAVSKLSKKAFQIELSKEVGLALK